MNVLLCKYDNDDCIAQWIFDRADKVYLILDDFDANRGVNQKILDRMEKIYYISTFDSIDEITAVAADLIANNSKINQIASFTEFSQYGAGLLAQLLGIESYSVNNAFYSRNKTIMKHMVGKKGIRHPKFISIPVPAKAKVLEIEKRVGYPLVIKPVSGMGTLSTEKIDNRCDLERFLEEYSVQPELNSGQLIAEEYIEGVELHVDAVWRDWEPWIFSISKYFCPQLSHVGVAKPNGSVRLDGGEYHQLYSRILSLSRSINEALGIIHGATHLELFLTKNGELYFSEIATRFGGGYIFELLKYKFGVDEREVWVHELCRGDVSELHLKNKSYPYLGRLNIEPDRSGVIAKMPDVDSLKSDPRVFEAYPIKKIGDSVCMESACVWCYMVFFGANSESELTSLANELFMNYKIEVV